MTPPTAWHPPEELMQAYVDGGLPGLSAASVESHLVACRTCRAAVSGGVDAGRLAKVKDRLDDRLDRAERPWLERLLVRTHVDEADARALLAAPSLRRAWVLAIVGAALLGMLVANDTRDPEALFMVLAPLVPLMATAAAYAPALDAAFSLVAATPYPTARLLLARSLAVGTTSLVAVVTAALVLPDRHVTGVVWLLPAVALTLLVLVLAPRVGTGPAAVAVAVSWLGLVAGLERGGGDVEWIAGAVAQVLAGATAAVALAVLAGQWKRVDLRGTP